MRDEPGLPQPGDLVGGKYRVEQAIGAGGMGAVYRATHELTGKAVAIKWLRPRLAAEPRALKRFLREAQASARIRHPNVVDIYDIEEQDGQAFLVLELLEGETLRSLLLRRRRLSVGECLSLLVPAMRGVAAAHARGVVHRDIKPDNLFITRAADDPERRVPKVLDFGISKVAADTPLAEGTLTATGAMLGTPHYMSLEQLQGAEVDARSDVYAFGVVLYEALTGRRPFDGESFSAIVVKVATETPVDPCALRSDLPPGLGELVLKAMARHDAARWPTMRALIDALVPFLPADQAAPDASSAQSIDASSAEAASASQPGPRVDAELTRTSGRERAARPAGRVANRPSPLHRSLLAVGLFALLLGVGAWRLAARPADAVTNAPAGKQPARGPAVIAAAEEPARAGPKASREAAPTSPAASATAADETPAASALSPHPPRFRAGWVYLGEHDEGRWVKRYFDGWGKGMPAVGATIKTRGRSFVRAAMPDGVGAMARVLTTIAMEHPVEVLEVSRWKGSGWVWARVRADW